VLRCYSGKLGCLRVERSESFGRELGESSRERGCTTSKGCDERYMGRLCMKISMEGG